MSTVSWEMNICDFDVRFRRFRDFDVYLMNLSYQLYVSLCMRDTVFQMSLRNTQYVLVSVAKLLFVVTQSCIKDDTRQK